MQLIVHKHHNSKNIKHTTRVGKQTVNVFLLITTRIRLFYMITKRPTNEMYVIHPLDPLASPEVTHFRAKLSSPFNLNQLLMSISR